MPFSKGSSPTVKNMWLQDQDKVIKNYKHLPHNMHYKAQTSKVQEISSSKLSKVDKLVM